MILKSNKRGPKTSPLDPVPFSLAEKKMQSRAKDSTIREKSVPLRASLIARITSDFKLDLFKAENLLKHQ